MKDQN